MTTSEPFKIWCRRRAAEGLRVTLIDLYRLVAETRGLEPHELPLNERASLRDRALPVMWPGYQVPPASERAERDPVEVVGYDATWADSYRTWQARLAAVLGRPAERIE